MELGIVDFLRDIETPTKRLTITQLREREDFWRSLWSYTPDEVKFYLKRIGTIVRVVKRDYKGQVGLLSEFKFNLSEVELVVEEKFYNSSEGRYYNEKKVTRIPASTIMLQEFILDSTPSDEADELAVMPIPDDETPT